MLFSVARTSWSRFAPIDQSSRLVVPLFNLVHNVRQVHSERQIKRLFKHPARNRVEKRMGVDRTPAPLPPPTYPPIFQPEMLSNGWSAPPGPDVSVPEYPFKISRTKNKPNDSIGFLPVYSKHRKDGTLITTRVKRISGDCDAFLRELRSVLNLPPPKNENPRDDAIRTRMGGTIEIKGNRVREVKSWLAGLGF